MTLLRLAGTGAPCQVISPTLVSEWEPVQECR